MLFSELSLALILAFVVPAASSGEPAHPFDGMKSLAGHWSGTSSQGRKLDISYRLIANESVLVETWKSPSGRETMTVYHKDGAALIATHYCAQGNQPRLNLTMPRKGGRFVFDYKDATNLASTEDAHLHSFWIETDGGQTMRRSETYTEAGTASEEQAILKRVASR